MTAEPDIDLGMPPMRPPPMAPSYSAPNVYDTKDDDPAPPRVFQPAYSVATGLSSSDYPQVTATAIATPFVPSQAAKVAPVYRPEPVSPQQQQQRRQAAPPRQRPSPLSSATRSTLLQQGYTNGLIDALNQNRLAFAQTFWIVDNSGSMQTRDGQRTIVGRNGHLKFTRSTRWSELQQTVEYHMQLAHLLQAPTTFRLLNDPGRVAGPQVVELRNFTDAELALATNTLLNAQPAGVTPLTQHILEIRAEILRLPLEPGEKVAIVLATDGIPTNEQGYASKDISNEFVQALRSLAGLPVWVVVRLCTDEEHVVDFWNNLDNQLELELEVLDDFVSEAREVVKENPFVNYTLPIHRMREMGFYHKVFDRLDESKLSTDEVRDFLRIVLGNHQVRNLPENNMRDFTKSVEGLVRKLPKIWNPVTKKVGPWVDTKALGKAYGGGGWFW